MATLEMVQLRSPLPTGRLTLRHAVPLFNPTTPDDLMARIDDVLAVQEKTTTPKVGAASGDVAHDSETAAGKGRTAR